MKRIKIFIYSLIVCLFSFVSVSFASIYNEDSIVITNTPNITTNQISTKSGSVVANVTTMSSKIPTIIVENGVVFSTNTTYGSGTILNSVNGILKVGDNVNFSFNAAFESGGAIYNLNLTSVTVIGNGVSFSTNTATNAGGAIYNKGNLKIGDNVNFYGNKFTNTTVNGIYVDGEEILLGGAIYHDGGSVEIAKQKWLSIGENASFLNNTAYKGGAIYAVLSSVTIGSNVDFENNSTNYRGGAVYVFRSTFTLEDGASFLSNSARDKGGAIYAFDSVLNLNAVDKEIKFNNNTADGGGIYSVSSEINLKAINNNITFENKSSIKSTGTTVMNIETSSSSYVLLDADVSIEGGTINFNSGEVKVGSNCATFRVGVLNLSSGTFDLSDRQCEKPNTVYVTTFTSTENVNLIIGLSTEPINGTNETVYDKFSIGTTAKGIVKLTGIHIYSLSDSQSNSGNGSIIFFSGGNLEDLIIKVSTKPVYRGETYAFFQSSSFGVLDFSIITKLIDLKDVFLSTDTIAASCFSGNLSIAAGTVKSHLAIYGEGNNDKLTTDKIVINSAGALSLFGHGNSPTQLMTVKRDDSSVPNILEITNKNYFYAENVNFSQGNINNLCLIGTDTSPVVSSSYSNSSVRFIAYNSSFSNSSILNQSSITLKDITKGETKNFVVNVKLSSVTFYSSSAENGAIVDSTYIKIDTVTNTNINNKIICLIDSATFRGNTSAIHSSIKGVDIDSTTSNGVVINNDVQYKMENKIIFESNKSTNGGAIYSSNSLTDTQIKNFSNVKNSSFTSNFSYLLGDNVIFLLNKATENGNGGAIYNYVKKSSANVFFDTDFTLGSNITFTSNNAENGNGGAVYNYNGEIEFEDGVNFSSNSAQKGGAIYNEQGIIDLTAKENDIIFNGNTGDGGAIYDNGGTINLNVYNGRKIVFQTSSDTIVSEDSTSILNINEDAILQNEAIIEINSDMSNFKGTTNIYSGIFKFGTLGNLFGGNTVVENAVFDFSNNTIKNYDLSNFKINNKLGLLIDVDLAKKQMDTISSASNSMGSGSIYIKNFNLVSSTSVKSIDILFTSSTVLKGKVSSYVNASSDEYIYDVDYDKNTGFFTFTNRFVANPVTMEATVALLAGAMATQENVLNQAFVSMNTSFTNRHDKRLDITKDSKNLYASTKNFIFLRRSKIEGGLWLRPYGYKENLTMAGYDIENTIYGALAGIDLKMTDTKLLSFYIGYTGVNQKFENIKVDQNGYVFGVTGMLVKEKFYAGVTANTGVSDTKAESSLGTNDFQINTYAIGLNGGDEFNLNRVFILEPNLSLMYGYMEAEKYVTEQGAKVSKEDFNNFRIEPQLKFKFNLDDGWKPYALISYIYNTGKTNAVVNGNKKQEQQLDPYCEYGAGLEKNFIGTAWVGFAQVSAKTGGKKGVGINIGIKYAF